MTQSTVSPVSRKSCITERPDAALTRLFLEHGDNHIPNVIVIIDDENVLPFAHHLPTTGVPSIPALPILIMNNG
jgi:hypothetical protein